MDLEWQGQVETVLFRGAAQGTHSENSYFYALQRKVTSPEEVEARLSKRRLEDTLRWLAGDPVQRQDYEVAYLLVETYLTLPASHGMTSAVDTLRGTAKKTTHHPNFGLIADNKRYSKKMLMNLMLVLRDWLEAQEVIQREQAVPSEPWIQFKSDTGLGSAVLKTLDGWRK